MMGLFIFSKLLLMTLLLQFSEENTEGKTHTTAKPENSVRYGEFCLRISEDSLGTSSKPSTQLPTKSALPTQQPTQHKQLIQPIKKSILLRIQTTTEPPHPDSQSVQPNSEPTPTSTQLPAQTDQPEVVTQEQNNMMTTAAVLEQVIPKCRCTMEDMKQPAETSPVSILTILFPSEMCNTIEIIRSVKHETKTLATSPAPLDTTTELPITTQPSVKKTTEEMPRVLSDRSEDALSDRCKLCESLTSLNDIDPAVVQVLIVEKQPSPCPVYLNVTLKNGRESCLVLHPLNLKQMMMMLEDKFAWTRMNSKDGCRCRDREKKDPFEMLAHKTTFIWPPGEGCHSADIIEISVGSEDVCVAASSVLDRWPERPHEKDLRTETHPMPEKTLIEVLSDVRFICLGCISLVDWNSLDPKDIESLEMDVPKPGCPVLILVKLKNKPAFCMDLSHPEIEPMLEKLKVISL